MRHRKAGRKLGRSPSHRLALKRNLAYALFTNERIITTLAKAKEMRPFVEKLITLAKRAVDASPEKALHCRRRIIAILGPMAKADARTTEQKTEAEKSKGKDKPLPLLNKLFDEIGPRFQERPGGYVRVIKRQERRLGDGGSTAYLALLGADEPVSRVREERRETTAPRLKVEEDEPEATTQEAPEEEKPTAEDEQTEASESEEQQSEAEAEEELESAKSEEDDAKAPTDEEKSEASTDEEAKSHEKEESSTDTEDKDKPSA